MAIYIPNILNTKRLNYNNLLSQQTCSLEPCPDIGSSGCCFIGGVLNPNITSEAACNSGLNYLLCEELIPIDFFGPGTITCPSGYTYQTYPGYPPECQSIRIVDDCSECDPYFGTCTSLSGESVWIENCENCIYAKYEHPVWTTGNVPYISSNCWNSFIGWYGCNTIATEIFIPKPSSLLTSSTNVNIIGQFDDSISIDGVVFGSCKQPGYINTSTILNASQSGFMLGAVDSFGACCHGFLAICFSEAT
jgi:hypothetical protein